jgi:hypothetical protein
MLRAPNQPVDGEWVTFPGGELEGKRPKVMCPACREQLKHAVRAPRSRPLCFQCYLAELERQRALQAAGQLDTASDQRFQDALPFLPVNRARLDRLKVERAEARQVQQAGVGRYVDKRRQAQIAARHALQRIVAGLDMRQATPAERERTGAAAIHAAELQFPDAWLPFVVSR